MFFGPQARDFCLSQKNTTDRASRIVDTVYSVDAVCLYVVGVPDMGSSDVLLLCWTKPASGTPSPLHTATGAPSVYPVM